MRWHAPLAGVFPRQRRLAECLARILTPGACQGRAHHCELVCPPVPLAGTGAEHIFAGLFNHPLTKPVHGYVRNKVLPLAPLSAEIHETDGHLANDRLRFHLRAEDRTPVSGA